MTRTIAAEVAARNQGNAPATGGGGEEPAALAIVRQYWTQLKNMLPSHVVPEAWYAGAFAALYRNKELFAAANRNPESLMFALMECARWGLDPGTKQYYLTPRPNRKAPGGVEVLGIIGYQGDIELIYRAGAVSSVIVETVRENDHFEYTPGRDEFPDHVVDWRKSRADRGPLLLAYSYARMKDGSYSRVAIVTRDDIARSKAASPTANSQYSPWKTDEEAMWRKTAAHRLTAWVPTSAEFVAVNKEILIEQTRARENAKVLPAHAVGQLPPPPDAAMVAAGGNPLGAGNENAESPMGAFAPTGFAPAIEGGDEGETGVGEPIDAEFTDGEEDLGAPAGEDPADAGEDGPATQGQHRKIMGVLGRRVGDDAHRHALFSAMLGRQITSQSQVSGPEAERVYDQLKAWSKAGELDARVAGMAPGAGEAPAPAGAPAPAELGEELPRMGSQAWHDAGHPTPTETGRVVTVPELLNGDCGFCEEIAAGGGE
jgi:recombination protein RecT